MTLFGHALKAMRRDKLVYSLAALQLAATILITLVMVSSTMLKYRYYKPFKDELRSNGIFCAMPIPQVNINPDGSLDYLTIEDIYNALDGETKILYSGFSFENVADENNEPISNISYDNVLYTDDMIEAFKPDLAEGRWLNTSDKADCVEAVVSKNDYGFKVGDRIRIVCFSDTIDDWVQEVLIVGELKDRAKIPCFHNGAGDVRKDNFMDFYGTVDYENALPALIFSSDYLAKTSSVWQTVSNYAIIVYPDDYPAESLKAEQQKLGRLGCRQFMSLRDMDKNSRQYLFKQIYDLLPIIIVLLALTAISGISSSALCTRREMKNFVVFYMVGLEWKRCARISLIQSLASAGAASALAMICVAVMQFTPLADRYKLLPEPITVLCAVGIIALYILVSMLMPMIMLSRSTPKQLLTK